MTQVPGEADRQSGEAGRTAGAQIVTRPHPQAGDGGGDSGGEPDTGRGQPGAGLAGTVAELPTGTVTLLFSDIEGSTALLGGWVSGTGRRCRRSGRCMRAAVAGSGGRELGTEGDSFFVVFDLGRRRGGVLRGGAAGAGRA